MDYGLRDRMRDKGDRLIGPCPVHGGDNPNAFVVSRSWNNWYCFTRCGRGGDVIDLVAGLEGAGLDTAARRLLGALKFNPEAPAHPGPRKQHYVPPDPKAIDKTFRPFTRRLHLDPYAALIRQKGIRVDTARRFEVGRYHGRGFLENCIAVRLHDLQGRPLGYAGRSLESNRHPTYSKWRVPPRFPKSQLLYAWYRVRRRTPTGLVLVECPWAVMRLAQLDIPAVALLGTALSRRQNDLLSDVSPLILMLDADPAGRAATARIARRLRGRVDIHIVALDQGCDPDDLTDRQLLERLRRFFP